MRTVGLSARSSKDAVRVGTMHGMKGLEFQAAAARDHLYISYSGSPSTILTWKFKIDQSERQHASPEPRMAVSTGRDQAIAVGAAIRAGLRAR
jgi:hypothetical protein